jgi:fluoroquinolone transport system permease protein
MNAFLPLFITELKFQWRHGFIIAAFVVTIVWALMLSLLPDDLRPFWFGVVAGVDIASIGLLFGFGLGVLDKNQKVIAAMRLTPIASWQLSLSRMVALGLLTSITLIILGVMVLSASELIPMFAGILLCSLFFAAVGVATSRRFNTVNGFMIFFALSGFIWAMPILYYSDVVSHWLWVLLPSGGALALIKQAVFEYNTFITILSYLSQLFWISLTLYLAERWAPISFEHRFGGH